MVYSWDARDDVDNELLTKTITYRRFTNEKNDLAYDTYNRSTYTDYSIKAQCTIQTLNSKYVMEGILKEGDLVLFMRHTYDTTTTNTTINPVLTPKKGDKVQFLSHWFVIKQTTPATSEDDGIIGWDCTAGQSD